MVNIISFLGFCVLSLSAAKRQYLVTIVAVKYPSTNPRRLMSVPSLVRGVVPYVSHRRRLTGRWCVDATGLASPDRGYGEARQC